VSENLNPLVAALESLSEKDLEITVTESEQIFKRGVINYVVERNALVASVRQVALKDVLNYTDRYIASKLDIEDPRDIFFHAAREVTNFVDYAIDGPASNKAPVVEFRDLLPSAHRFKQLPLLLVSETHSLEITLQQHVLHVPSCNVVTVRVDLLRWVVDLVYLP